jgi:class 3 adenylate cyclase
MPDKDLLNRLRFLARVVERERTHLLATDQRIFAMPFSMERAQKLDTDVELAERVEAFVARFSRLQDTLGDKLLPALLRALGEPLGAVIDNLDRAERLGWLASADEWLFVRQLRNQMIHEYIEDPAILVSALQSGHERVPMLVSASAALLREIVKRGWLVDDAEGHPHA